MLGFFRRITNSKIGLVITFVTLGMIALAFAAGDVTGLSAGSGGMTKTTVARIGNVAIGEAQLKQRVGDQLNEIHQQNPGVDMPTFVANGGVEGVLDQLITGIALEKFGQDQGMAVSRAVTNGSDGAVDEFSISEVGAAAVQPRDRARRHCPARSCRPQTIGTE